MIYQVDYKKKSAVQIGLDPLKKSMEKEKLKEKRRARLEGTFQGEVIGIDLNEWSMNTHDGVVNGLFVRREDIEKYDPEKEKLEESNKLLKICDTVDLTGAHKGIVKFMGPITGSTEMIGVELQRWNTEAHDGTYRAIRYFTAPEGRGTLVTAIEPLELTSNTAHIPSYQPGSIPTFVPVDEKGYHLRKMQCIMVVVI